MTVVVVAAMREELETLARRLDRRAPAVGSSVHAELAGRSVVLHTTGEGAGASGREIGRLLGRFEPEVVLGVGVGGGLSDELVAGDLVGAREVVGSGEARLVAPPSLWLERGLSAAGVRAGVIVASEAILARASAKRSLSHVAGAAPALVDLESHAWATACDREGVPWVITKCVCDPLDEDLPLDFEAFRGPEGAVDRGRVMRAALVQPALWAPLRRLQRRVADAAHSVADWVTEVAAP